MVLPGAKVKVDIDARTGKVKDATAHDLRWAFGTRWASRIMPKDLMVLMRHESIETTMKYYVDQKAETTAEVLYQAIAGNTLGNSAHQPSLENETIPPQINETTGFSE